MRFGGREAGILVIILTILIAATSIYYTNSLAQQRQQAIEQLATIPDTKCNYADASLCPQAEAVVIPDYSGLGIVLLGILLGIYLLMNDVTQRRILGELESKRSQIGKEERLALVMSVLTTDERKIIQAVREQPGISQATLRLRTDMSKAKLSMLLKDLQARDLITKIEDGKTNTVHLKREL